MRCLITITVTEMDPENSIRERTVAESRFCCDYFGESRTIQERVAEAGHVAFHILRDEEKEDA